MKRAGPASAPLEQAKALALRLLAARARSGAQIRARLESAGHAAVTGEVVAWLERLGYLDDAAYARSRARAMLAPGRLGPRAAERRLLAAGIDPDAARAAVARAAEESGREVAPGDPPEIALCREALARRARGADPGSLDDRTRARLARYLAGRGFSGEAVARVLGLRIDADG